MEYARKDPPADPMTVDRAIFGEGDWNGGWQVYSAEQSHLGILAAMRCPRQLIVPALGNGQPFAFRYYDAGGTAYYDQGFGCVRIKLWND